MPVIVSFSMSEMLNWKVRAPPSPTVKALPGSSIKTGASLTDVTVSTNVSLPVRLPSRASSFQIAVVRWASRARAAQPDTRSDLAPTGTLRVGINHGNLVLAQKNPATGEVICKVAEGDKADIDKAVAAARKAFDQLGLEETAGKAAIKAKFKERNSHYDGKVEFRIENGEIREAIFGQPPVYADVIDRQPALFIAR